MRTLFLLGALLLAAGTAVAQTFTVTPRGLLPGDAAIAAAPNSQQEHAGARGSDASLVVWSDYRGQAAGGGTNQSGGDIFGVRLDAAGNALESAPFLIAGGMGLQNRPLVAWNGTTWLVVYQSQDPVGGYYGTRIRAVRVSAAGVVLDATPLVLPATAFEPSTIGLQVAGQGGQWLITRCLYHDDGYGTYLAGQRVDASGQLLDTTPLVLVDWVYGQTRVLAAGGEYLVAGPDWNNSATARARRVAGTGQTIGAVFNLPSLNLASSGSEYYVTWVADHVNLVGSRLTTSDTLLTPAGTVLVADFTQYHQQALSHDGVNWWLVWGAADQLRTLRIDAAGTPLDADGGVLLPITIGGTINNAYDPAMVPRPGGGVHVLWYDLRAALGGDANVFVLPVSAANAPGGERCVSTGTRNQREPDLSGGPDGRIAIAFVSEAANDDRVLLHFLAPDGQALTATPVEVAAAPTIGRASVAWNGAMYMVTWDQGVAGQTTTQIKARRLHADGTFVDATPLDVMTGFSPDIEALGEDFLVAAARFGAYPQYIDAWRRVIDGPTGTFPGPAALIGGGYVSSGPRVRSDGSRWLVTYHSHWSHDNPASDAVYNFVAPDGTFTPASNPATTSGSSGTPDVAFSGSVYLFVWRNNSLSNANNYIAGRIMNADGTFLTGNFTIAEATGRQLRPVVGFDGANFVVAWDDQRGQEAFFDERTDIYGARVSPAGVVLDPSGFVVAANPQGDATAAILCRSNGVSHVAWTQFETTGAPHDSYRIGHADLNLQQTLSAVETPAAGPRLEQNVPNPFNPITRIAFTLADAGAVRLAVYDLRGRQVRTLVDGARLAAGEHVTFWDGRGDDGRPVATGVYVYELRTSTHSVTRRLTLAK